MKRASSIVCIYHVDLSWRCTYWCHYRYQNNCSNFSCFLGNDTVNEISDDEETFGFDEVDEGSADEAGTTKWRAFVNFLEMVGSLVQLIYGGIVAYFSSASQPPK